jgi:hypothetical protein
LNKTETKQLKKVLILFTVVILCAFAVSIHYTLTYALDITKNFPNSSGISGYKNVDEEKKLEQFYKFVTVKLNQTFSTLKTVSENHLFKNFDYTANVSKVVHGIPNYLEKSKREFLSNVLKENPDIASIFLVLPGGNIYLGEPFSYQEQLPRLNFADREWYKGVNLRDSLYMSTVFSSAAINTPAIAVAIPITNSLPNGSAVQYKSAESDKLGYLVSIMDFNYTRELIFKNVEGTGDTFHLVDRNGTELINSNNKTYSKELVSFDYKDIGKSDINPHMITTYEFNEGQDSRMLYLMPITVTGNTWYLVMISPR